jgi:hypothetical protein
MPARAQTLFNIESFEWMGEGTREPAAGCRRGPLLVHRDGQDSQQGNSALAARESFPLAQRPAVSVAERTA